KHSSSNLALAGGCAMNSVANGKVYLRTPFRKMYLPAAAGDAGGAIGAATYVLSQLTSDLRPPIAASRIVLDDAYSGPQFSTQEIGTLIESRKKEIREQRCEISEVIDQEKLCKKTAAAIAEGKV